MNQSVNEAHFSEAPLSNLDSAWSRLWRPALNDPRDIVFVNYSVLLSLTLIPIATAFFVAGQFSWWWAAAYWAPFLLWLPRFILMGHCTIHRPLFNRRFAKLNQYIPWILSPLAGITPETYFVHHVGMHHREGNLLNDLSTTMPYQRDNILHWLHYWATFMTVGIFKLAAYHAKSGRSKLLKKLIIGELSYWAIVLNLGYWVSWQAAVVVFIGPLLLTRSAMMIGNWGQHAFVDPQNPSNDFTSSTTTINTTYNRRCFNDGYHIVHHLKPAMHFADMANEFKKNPEVYGAQDALVFDGVDQFGIWIHLMTKQHRRLAKHFVHLPGAPERTEEEVVELLKSRLVPIAANQPAQQDSSADQVAAHAA